MTQDQWNTCCDPAEMLEFLRNSGRLSERKVRLFAAACCRQLWPLLTHVRSRKTVLLSERYADALATKQELKYAHEDAFIVIGKTVSSAVPRSDGCIYGEDYPSIYAADAAWRASADLMEHVIVASSTGGIIDYPSQLALAADIFDNPFRPPPATTPFLLTASSSEPILSLARSAYDERQMPQAHLANAKLAKLADALEEAGCQDAQLLSRLRSEGPHVRGCTALDRVLGKS